MIGVLMIGVLLIQYPISLPLIEVLIEGAVRAPKYGRPALEVELDAAVCGDGGRARAAVPDVAVGIEGHLP